MVRTPESEIRKSKALSLRKAGATYQQIADQLGYTPSGAFRAVESALKDELSEAMPSAHRLDESRLNQLLMALYPRALRGEAWAVDRVLKIIDMRGSPVPPELALKVTDSVRKDLEKLPEDQRGSALAVLALQLAEQVDRGVSPVASAKELRTVLVQLFPPVKAKDEPKPVTNEEPGVADITSRIAARRRKTSD